MSTILITAPSLAPAGLAVLERAGSRVLFVKGGASELEDVMAREPIDAVISRTMGLGARAIDSCPSLRVISKHGAGVNNIDVEAATRRGIPVFYTPGANAQAVAELTIGLMVAVARTLPLHDRALHGDGWTRSTIGIELSGRTIGIVGFGQIGSRVARFAEALGMNVLIYDPHLRDAGVRREDRLHAFLAQIDVLSLHCPLTTETRGMIGTAELALLPPNGIVLNTARGGIVDEPALVEALRARTLLGAALDGFTEEPLPLTHPLRGLDNVILTPHIGGSTDVALDSVAVIAAATALAYLEGAHVDASLCVNPTVLSARSEALHP